MERKGVKRGRRNEAFDPAAMTPEVERFVEWGEGGKGVSGKKKEEPELSVELCFGVRVHLNNGSLDERKEGGGRCV